MPQPQVDEDQFGERNEGKKDIWSCVNKCMDYFPSAKNLICTNNLSIFFFLKKYHKQSNLFFHDGGYIYIWLL